ncbi:hypothetical protein ZHS_73 [Edwardsiella phage vB_EpM_ZHS]|jgi:hypothetical protein|nr:hypothetical protein ZHS_73 [Edwardsiella phage vB_EpM_ZHS]
MSKPSPTGRLSESQPEFQDVPHPFEVEDDPLPRGGAALSEFAHFSPGLWERLERSSVGFKRGEVALIVAPRLGLDKSRMIQQLFQAREVYLGEQRELGQLGQLAIRKAITAFFASLKR